VSYTEGAQSPTAAPGVTRKGVGDGLQPHGLELTPLADLESCRSEWTELATRSGNVFLTWEWASTWWHHFGEGRRMRLVGMRRPGRPLVAILPLYEASRGALRVARLVGHGLADQLGLVCDPGDRMEVADGLRRTACDRTASWDLVLAERLPADETWADQASGRVVRRESSPVLPIEGSWDDFLASRSGNFRGQVRRRERKLRREWGLQFRLCEEPQALARDLEALFALHDARWGGASDAFSRRRRAFHLDFAASALERGWLRLWTAEVAGRPIAAWYGFRFGGAEWYYQAGWDPAWSHSSIGFVLLAHTMREAFGDGMREYRLLLGAEPYKARFAREDRGVESFVLGNTRRGRAVAAGGALIARLPGRLGKLPAPLIDRRPRR
jgi:CelD/BcsL family acetyltransferase involved in cellulose biosynthesis